jgi:hypothetical protein
MSGLPPSIFRDALQVSPERIAAMGDTDVSVLMTELIEAQAYHCHSALGAILVNTEGTARDDGCEGWSAKPAVDDDWLGNSDTCWQLKSGNAGMPPRLKGEVTKPIPAKTL